MIDFKEFVNFFESYENCFANNQMDPLDIGK